MLLWPLLLMMLIRLVLAVVLVVVLVLQPRWCWCCMLCCDAIGRDAGTFAWLPDCWGSCGCRC
jgi:hypothetical protein